MKKFLSLLAAVAILSQGTLAGYSVPMTHVYQYNGRVVNNGQCATGVQQIFKDYYGRWILSLTKNWRRGAAVWGNRHLAPGTAIASFTSTGRYWAHAAIYQGQNGAGIQVYDQWAGQPWHPRTLRKNYSGSKPQSNDADYFYVIEN